MTVSRNLIGFRIRELRKAKRLTQVELARHIGISASYLNLIEANKRTIAGHLLHRLAEVLELDPQILTGQADRQLVDELIAVGADPLLRDLRLTPSAIQELVGRTPAFGRALLTLFRAYRENVRTVSALSDRLNRDPLLGDLVHQLLSHVTAMRSMSEILDSVDDLGPDRRRGFLAAMNQESSRLSDVATSLASFFQQTSPAAPTLSPADEVDDFITASNNHFPELETASTELAEEITRHGETMLSAMIEYLGRKHGITLSRESPLTAELSRYRNQCYFDEETKRLRFLDNTSIPTLRFQVARLVIEKALSPLVESLIESAPMSTDGARRQAIRALASYGAGAMLFPYEQFINDAREARYDIEILRQKHGASFEQLCHRLTTLRRPNDEAIPFAFMRCNPAGFTSKRLPIPGFPLPSQGHACPLWAVYGCFQTPGRVLRQYVEFPDHGRYLFVARTVTKRPPTFHAPQFLYAVMIACDVIYADQTVYGDGLNLSSTGIADPVGVGCHLCPRRECRQREQAAISPEDPVER